MELMFLILKTFLLLSGGGMLLILAIYWFELDEKFVRWFEPIFRKLTD